ncbi:uncharacterized protein LOC116571522 [Mustela erminea]|uniref:uncharacterized protein LOC116571522 n=1 Tax=Mustela erminea TaxID=36723 RepID=UPI001386AC5E|nr:uncharacterized protein LOC116571522 [Mustela erminea]
MRPGRRRRWLGIPAPPGLRNLGFSPLPLLILPTPAGALLLLGPLLPSPPHRKKPGCLSWVSLSLFFGPQMRKTVLPVFGFPNSQEIPGGDPLIIFWPSTLLLGVEIPRSPPGPRQGITCAISVGRWREQGLPPPPNYIIHILPWMRLPFAWMRFLSFFRTLECFGFYPGRVYRDKGRGSREQQSVRGPRGGQLRQPAGPSDFVICRFKRRKLRHRIVKALNRDQPGGNPEPEFQPRWAPRSHLTVAIRNSGGGVRTCSRYVPDVEKSKGAFRVFVCVSSALQKRTLYFPGHPGRAVEERRSYFGVPVLGPFLPRRTRRGEDPRLGAFVPKQMKREVAWGQYASGGTLGPRQRSPSGSESGGSGNDKRASACQGGQGDPG